MSTGPTSEKVDLAYKGATLSTCGTARGIVNAVVEMGKWTRVASSSIENSESFVVHLC